jgi:hypothetical protein
MHTPLHRQASRIMMATVSTLKKFHVGSKKMRPWSGRMENWYVIAIPKIDLLAALVLDPGYGFTLELSVDTP